MATHNNPADLTAALIGAVEGVTKKWAKQRKAEERRAAAELNRHLRMTSWRGLTIKQAAWMVMKDAYLAASDNGQLPANARQIMYAARPEILRLTERDNLNDQYFTQTLLPDYIVGHPVECNDWDVVYDARGTFTEPHTGREVPLGTLEVRRYLGERPTPSTLGLEVAAGETLTATAGPENRYRNILFIEKEGFDPLLQAARIAERFDVAIMSTKGMSTTSARRLLDCLAPNIEQILVLHDFDVAGFSILGTLAEHSRRYVFDNDVQLTDIGLRLEDVEDMALQSEPVRVSEWGARRITLRRHGATRQEIAFLQNERVELNAMTSRQFIDRLEQKFAECGVERVIPENDVLERHWRWLVTQRLARAEFAEIRAEIEGQAAAITAPEGLAERVAKVLQQNPEYPWEYALSQLLMDDQSRGGQT